MKSISAQSRTCLIACLSFVSLTGCAGPGASEDDGATHPAATAEQVAQAKQALQFRGNCTSRQRQDLGTFHGWLYDYVSDANYHLQTGSAEQRLVSYFNPATDDQRSTVFRTVDDMQYSLETYEYHYNCVDASATECADYGDAAWVSAGQTNHEINLCPVFWDQDNQGRLFILAHELSHISGTGDYTYPGYDGMDSALIFAQYFPEYAVVNANNYGLFVMNPWGVEH